MRPWMVRGRWHCVRSLPQPILWLARRIRSSFIASLIRMQRRGRGGRQVVGLDLSATTNCSEFDEKRDPLVVPSRGLESRGNTEARASQPNERYCPQLTSGSANLILPQSVRAEATLLQCQSDLADHWRRVSVQPRKNGQGPAFHPS